MFGIDDAIGQASKLIDDGINKIWPDPTAKATAEALTIKATADAAIAQLQTSMSAIVEEAKSTDPWTSRARPSFLYVMYTFILMAIPYSFAFAFAPEAAAHMVSGMQSFLSAIPEGMWATFGIGYTGYVGARSYEKAKGVSK